MSDTLVIKKSDFGEILTTLADSLHDAKAKGLPLDETVELFDGYIKGLLQALKGGKSQP